MLGDAVAERDRMAGAASRSDLVEGLVLVRASTLKLARLQLALERRDRKVALEAVDDLVRFDERLEQHLAGIRDPHAHSVMDLAVAVERAALNREKLTLAAEIISNGNDASAAVPPLREQDGSQLVVPPPMADDVTEESFPAEDWAVAWEENRPPRRGLWWLAALILLLSLAGGAVWMFGQPAVSQWLETVRPTLPGG
jgi:hypothetical protein